ncbi:maleylacetoacetate isomerase [bacterium]|nr:maleylacetoacetate isomerase [bacterium]
MPDPAKEPKFTLYAYWRSSASFRVRIALNIKEIGYRIVPINLLKKENLFQDFLEINPEGRVPALQCAAGTVLTQSLAIVEFLDEIYAGGNKLLEKNPHIRVHQRRIAEIIACDIHPKCNIDITNRLGYDMAERGEWSRPYIQQGLEGVERILAEYQKELNPKKATFQDVFLIPQVWNALRFHIPIGQYAFVMRRYEYCLEMPAFQKAMPEHQPDAPDSDKKFLNVSI